MIKIYVLFFYVYYLIRKVFYYNSKNVEFGNRWGLVNWCNSRDVLGICCIVYELGFGLCFIYKLLLFLIYCGFYFIVSFKIMIDNIKYYVFIKCSFWYFFIGDILFLVE